jgi:hypothetical protein
MDKRSWLLFLFFSLLVWIQPLNTNAETQVLDRAQVFELLEEAFDAQVSLSEKGRTMAEIEGILNPYFAEHYKSMFIKENVIGQENQYQTYGTDFAPYYIPFYGFSDKTKVVNMENEIYVLEYFPGNAEGPVSYESHYEALKLVNENGSWKVSEYLYENIPEEVIKEAYPEKVKKQTEAKRSDVSKAADKEDRLFSQTLVFGPNFSSLRTFMEFGVTFGSESKTLLFGFL